MLIDAYMVAHIDKAANLIFVFFVHVFWPSAHGIERQNRGPEARQKIKNIFELRLLSMAKKTKV